MATGRLPLPAISRRVSALEWVFVLGGWLLLNLLAVGPLSQKLAERGVPISPEQLRIGLLLDWLIWVPLVPLIFRALDRFPLRAGVRLRNLCVWVLICVGFGAFHALVMLPLIHLLGHALGVPPAALSVPDLRLGQMVLDDAQNTQLAVIAYWILQFRYRGRDERAQAGLGSYQLGELLGRGGMGEVYKATHRMLGRPVAIKVIRPEMIGARDGAEAQLAIRRFRREAEVAASLRSPHTVELHDFGVTTDQAFYFVMELLDGMDLESLVRQTGPLPAARAIHILRQVCESLEEAHARGLVHRDIKPANIHVGRLGLRHDFVKVLDFGLVKSVEGVPEDSLATAAGVTPGTPAYMAPEMVSGEAFDGRADIYALGCVAYYLTTGHRVFEADSPFQMIAKHLREEPVPPSRRAELDVPPALDQLILACLAKEPQGRPQSAMELSRLLGAIEVEEWGEEQAMQWWRRHQPGQ